MRIRSRAYGSAINPGNACSSFGSGETRDYTVNILGTQLGTKEISLGNNIEIYPNPTADLLHIQGKEFILLLEVYNMEGRKIKRQTINNSNITIDVSAYVPGEYLVKIFTRTNNRTFKVFKN
ncbi:T9SS type A sorting domain-containing protein [Chryseobacterium sp. JJR-5R]|uniref:T9SS type A sorting domain-containing protein n=1 Tax=Chryseobacterium sp. JJR-5R TaxID=3093923 RepID=UPI002A747C1F|nr:T9SS type A sorting domain-containing protein [Chryseobacterium sp. JJR-5R]WPO84400.1 T9SS type A sorting domain-containing protein [Chryseobacterium sp. JJR-5R]